MESNQSSPFTRIIVTLLSTAALIFVLTTAFSFFGIGFETYGNYLLWFVALALFYSVLPAETGVAFA